MQNRGRLRNRAIEKRGRGEKAEERGKVKNRKLKVTEKETA
jgi:hypothetical protein